MSSGKVNIISSVKKREALSRFYTGSYRLHQIWNIDLKNLYRSSIRSMMSPDIQTLVIETCETKVFFYSNTTISNDCKIRHEETKFSHLMESFTKKDKLPDLLRLNLSRTKGAIDSQKESAQRAMALLETLKN